MNTAQIALPDSSQRFAAPDVDRPMRILWVKVGGLWPVNSGGRLRSFHIISELSRRHSVSVLTTHMADEDIESLIASLPHCLQVKSSLCSAPKHNTWRFMLSLLRSWFSALPVDLYKYRIEALRQEVDRQLASGDYDLCVADFLTALPNLPASNRLPVLFFAHNVEYMIWKRLCRNEGNWLRRALLAVEWRKMRRYEMQCCRRAQLVVAVSEEDRTQLLNESRRQDWLKSEHEQRVTAIPTGVDIDYFQPSTGPVVSAALVQKNPALARGLEIVFTGSMDWHPNEDAMLWFMQEILPIIRQSFPTLVFTVVGRNPSQRLRTAATKARVQLSGTVADIRPWVERASVYVVPLRIGGGTRLKIFEALAMGKAVVSTTIGAEGLPLQNDLHILRADTPQSFADCVIALLGNRTRRQRMGTAGRHLMEEQFAWPRVAAEFSQRCASLIHPIDSTKG